LAAVSNSTPLIFLSKIGKIQKLRELFDSVIIPAEVYEEVVVAGKKGGHPDAIAVEELVKRGFIVVKEVETAHFPNAPIEEGEKATISLALAEGIQTILIDEAKVRRMAKLLGLTPRGTVWILSRLYEEGIISKEDLKNSIFELIEKGFRIREELLVDILRELE
jgi:hypothetical protein